MIDFDSALERNAIGKYEPIKESFRSYWKTEIKGVPRWQTKKTFDFKKRLDYFYRRSNPNISTQELMKL